MKIIHKFKNTILNKGIRKTVILFDSLYGLGKLEKLISLKWFNPFLTLWLNLRSLPFHQAIRLPIWVYGKPRFYSLSGTIIIEGKIKFGMIKFNKVRPGAPSYMGLNSEIYNLGNIIIQGSGYFGTGNKIFINYGAELTLGNNFAITDMVNLGCMKKIVIKSGTSITHRCQLLDSNYHYVANFNNNTIPDRAKPLIIGERCWIGNSTTITGGTILPDFTIVASNSLVNSSTNKIPKNSIIGGVPAKLIRTGFRRVYNKKLNIELNKYFEWNTDPFNMSQNISMEECSEV